MDKMEAVMRTFLLTLLCSGCCIGYKNAEEADDTFLLNLVWKCTRTDDVANCLKLKAIKLLDKMVHTKDSLVITEYLTLAKNPKISYSDFQELNATETNWEGKSSKTEKEKSENLDNVIWEKLVSLFTTRTLQLSLSADAFEGRGKGGKIFKKGHGVFLMAAMMGGMMMKMAMAKIALIAGKALIIGKIALILSLLIALKKFASHGGGGGGGAEVVYTSAEHGAGRKFEFDSINDSDGTDLAYNAYKPEIYKNF